MARHLRPEAGSGGVERTFPDDDHSANELGLGAEGLAVADVLTVASSLVRLVRERDAPAIVVGTRGHSPVRQILVGRTARDVIRRAPCPVTVVNQLTTGGEEEGEGVG